MLTRLLCYVEFCMFMCSRDSQSLRALNSEKIVKWQMCKIYLVSRLWTIWLLLNLSRHLKDVILLTAIVQVLSTITSYFWYLWLLVRPFNLYCNTKTAWFCIFIFEFLSPKKDVFSKFKFLSNAQLYTVHVPFSLFNCNNCFGVCSRLRLVHCTCSGWTSWAPGLWQKARLHRKKWMRRSREDKSADR